MTEKHIETLQYFVASGGNGSADGTLQRPFGSFRQAIDTLRNGALAGAVEGGAPGRRRLEIVFIDGPNASLRRGRRPQYEFFVDMRRGSQGEGTELAPWPDFEAALTGLGELHESGELNPRAGQRIDVIHRDTFTASSFERTKKLKERCAMLVFLAMTLVCVIPVVATLSYLVYKAWPALTVEFLFVNPQQRLTAGGIWAPLIGTFFLVLSSLLVAAPIGILAGVYLNEYAGDNWVTRVINLAVVNLAGVPSIVHALFGVGAFVHFAHMGRSLMAAACTVAVMTLPVIITSTREALAAVPTSFREACWNMGASRWQTIRTIVLPNSIAGILTGVILQVARAAGETAPILFTGAVLFVPVAEAGWERFVPYGPADRFMALSYHLFALSTQIRGVSDELLFGTAVVLIGLVLVVNSLSIGLRIYLRARKRW